MATTTTRRKWWENRRGAGRVARAMRDELGMSWIEIGTALGCARETAHDLYDEATAT